MDKRSIFNASQLTSVITVNNRLRGLSWYHSSIPKLIVALVAGTEVSRIFFADTGYPSTWDSFRYFGSTTSRFDHLLFMNTGKVGYRIGG